jgi:uncharacterized protein YbbK (DUF523 family)
MVMQPQGLPYEHAPTKQETMKKYSAETVLVSACLVGIDCRFDGARRFRKGILEKLKGSVIIPVCPEQMGGLSTPRRPAEITQGTGFDVLQGKAKVLDSSGCDRTAQFLKGARAALRIARLNEVRKAYLKEKSPSCGKGSIVVRRKARPGPGVTAALLMKEGVEVVGV